MVQAPTLAAQVSVPSSGYTRTLMRGLVYTSSIPRFALARIMGKRYPVRALPLKLMALPEPEPRSGFERVKVRLSGICGSDLSLLYGKNSPSLSPFFSFPAVLGHEVLGETGGVRVAINPLLTGPEESPSLLSRQIMSGFSSEMLGFCKELPGGWADAMLVPAHRLHPIPPNLSDERAVLAEPFAVVVRSAELLRSAWPQEILIIGAGTIGLLMVQALRLLGYSGPLHIVARRPRQVELAKAFGATYTYPTTKAAQEAIGAKSYKGLLGTTAWRGGFATVIEASGSPGGLQEASWAVREGGRLLLVGAPGQALHDLSPYWYREVQLLGSYVYSPAQFALAIEMLAQADGLEQLVGERFPLEAWPDAIRTATKSKGSKVLFQPAGA